MSLDDQSRNLIPRVWHYLKTISCPLSAFEYWAVLFVACFSLFIPLLLFGIAAFLIFKTHREKTVSRTATLELPNVVLHIEMNHIKSLKEVIESNPEILYHQYKKQTLLAWCLYYNNPAAQSIILQLMKKHPQSQSIAA